MKYEARDGGCSHRGEGNQGHESQRLPRVTPMLFFLSASSAKMRVPGRRAQGPSALRLGLVECLAHSGGSVSAQGGQEGGSIGKMWEPHVC